MYYYILNPTAGKGSLNKLQDKLRSRLTELGIGGEMAKTTGPGDAVQMARMAIEKGYNTIVAVGGDGTVNEVINGITRDRVAVGIIPIGNSNSLANQFGIRSWQQACETLAARRLTSFGLIAAGKQFFLSTLTMGFETDLDKQVETSEQDSFKDRVGQFWRGWSHARKFTPLTCRIRADEKLEIECDLFSLSVTNQKFTNPLAENKLVVSISDRPSQTQLTTYIWQLLTQSGATEEVATTRFLADRLVIETTPVTGIRIDGKITGRTPIAVRLSDRRIRFITEKPDTGLTG